MNTVSNIYKELLLENCADKENIKENCKRYLKQLIESNIINATFFDFAFF